MSVSNLTNTKWVIKSSPELSFVDMSFLINFQSNNANYGKLQITDDGSCIRYYTPVIPMIPTMVYDYDVSSVWTSQAYRIIEITGGNDVTNSSLIQWLEDNATQIQVDDLTGTSWEINCNNWSTPPLSNEYYINGEITNYGSFSSLTINTNSSPLLTNISFNNDYNLVNEGHIVYNSVPCEITITNGTDIANPDLIVWLTENATLQTATYKTFDLSTLQLSAGTHTVKVKARASGYRDSNFSNSVSYVVAQPSGGTVAFTITQQMLSAKEYLRIYDGQDNTGNLLYESTSTASETLTPTLTCTTGYLYLEAAGSIIWINIRSVSGGVSVVSEIGDTVVFKVEANGTVNCDVDYQD